MGEHSNVLFSTCSLKFYSSTTGTLEYDGYVPGFTFDSLKRFYDFGDYENWLSGIYLFSVFIYNF